MRIRGRYEEGLSLPTYFCRKSIFKDENSFDGEECENPINNYNDFYFGLLKDHFFCKMLEREMLHEN